MKKNKEVYFSGKDNSFETDFWGVFKLGVPVKEGGLVFNGFRYKYDARRAAEQMNYAYWEGFKDGEKNAENSVS